ncbi:MAG: prepilin-type N-terminal cleavage/methylation domain-containing protein [Deltaproteobacteria bacterium]|nr:prepilin-type N-terminal cleavage/methylation domain-containing protein [Deltaproteobacteria bacterium]
MSRQLNEKGFTLVELLVALTIMAIGILAVVQMQIVALQSNSIANSLSVATSLAQEVMEDIQSWDVNTPPVIGAFTVTRGEQTYGRFSPVNPVYPFTPVSPFMNASSVTFQDSGTYTAKYTITLVQPDLTTAFISVTVTRGGRTVTLTSLKRIV